MDVEAKAVMRADNRRLASDLAKTRTMYGRAFGGIAGSVKSVMGAVLSPLGIAGSVAGIAALGKQVMAFNGSMTRLKIDTDASDEKMQAFRESILQISDATGYGRDELASAATAMVSLEGASGLSTEKLQLLATVGLATGASFDELAAASFALGEAFGLADPKALEQGFSELIAIGKHGAKMRDLAPIMREIGGAWTTLGGTKGPAGVARLAAAVQVLRGTYKSAEGAGAGLLLIQRTLTSTKAAKGLAKYGVAVYDKRGKPRDPLDILADIKKSKIGGNAKLLMDTVGGRPGAKAGLAKMLDDGIAATQALTLEAIKSDAVQTDAARRREGQGFKMAQAINRAKEAMMEMVTPERIKLFVETLQKAVEVLGWMVDHSKILAEIWLAGKFASAALEFGAAATAATTATKDLEVASAGVASKIGMWAGGIVAAGLAGVAFGKFLDDTFGLSDAISGASEGTAVPAKGKRGKGYVSNRAAALHSGSMPEGMTTEEANLADAERGRQEANVRRARQGQSNQRGIIDVIVHMDPEGKVKDVSALQRGAKWLGWSL